MASAWWQCPKCGRRVRTRGLPAESGGVRKKCPDCKTKLKVWFELHTYTDYYIKVSDVRVI